MKFHDLLSMLGKTTRYLRGTHDRTLLARTILARHGKCERCGWCCQLVVRCPHLAFDSQKMACCEIYERRPVNCKVFPRDDGDVMEVELSQGIKCGYNFRRNT